MSDLNANFAMENNMSLFNARKKITELLNLKYSGEYDYETGSNSNSNANSIVNSMIKIIDNASKLAYAISLSIKEGQANKYFRSEHMVVDNSNNLNSLQMLFTSLIYKLTPLLPTDISYALPETIRLLYDRYESFEKLYKKVESNIGDATKIGVTAQPKDVQTILEFKNKLLECTKKVDEFDTLVKVVKSNYNYTQTAGQSDNSNEQDTNTEVSVSNTNDDKLSGGNYMWYLSKTH